MEMPKRLFFGLDIDNPKTEAKILVFVIKVWSGFAIILILILWFSYEKIGVVGDMFGVVNSLFSGLAFAGIIYTVLLQMEELRAQREELILTRDELRGQKEEIKNQNLTLKLQRFDNTFFNLVTLHNDLTNQLTYSKHVGRPVFKKVLETKYITREFRARGIPVSGKEFDEMKLKYISHIFPDIKPFLEHYLKSLTGLISFVVFDDTIKENPEMSSKYGAILKSFISTYEIQFLYLHLSLSDKNSEQYKILQLLDTQLFLIDGSVMLDCIPHSSVRVF